LDWRQDGKVCPVRALGVVIRPALVAAALAGSLGGCGSSPATPLTCAAPDSAAQVQVGGSYQYASSSHKFHLRGTITFAQTDAVVEVTDTFYENARDRALGGVGELRGNRYDVGLVPLNGETNYRAEVSFVFGDGGRNFCLLGFSDTNGDKGGLGSYYGFRE
jgi:hypothetical protein